MAQVQQTILNHIVFSLKFLHKTQPAYLKFDTTHTFPVRNNRKMDLKEVEITRMTHKDRQALIVGALTRTSALLDARVCDLRKYKRRFH